MLTPVIQEEATGCGIASVANILGKSYQQMKVIASSMDIYAEDKSLWSDTEYVRKLLINAGVSLSLEEKPFDSWGKLPDTALLAIKPHCIDGINYWHWVSLSVSTVSLLYWIQPVICLITFAPTLIRCNQSGLLQ